MKPGKIGVIVVAIAISVYLPFANPAESHYRLTEEPFSKYVKYRLPDESIMRYAQGFESIRVPSGSMEPTLFVGDFFFADTEVYKSEAIKKNDVIVFFFKKTILVKRVIATGGEKLEVKMGKVLIDGQELDQSYIELKNREKFDSTNFGPIEVPKGTVFVMGDNRDHSNDSRFALGFVPIVDVIGKASVIWGSNNKDRVGLEIR